MTKLNTLYRDILTGLFFIAGIFGFVTGEFIFSTTLFGMASLFKNLEPKSARA